MLAAHGRFGIEVELTDDTLSFYNPPGLHSIGGYTGEVSIPVSAIVDLHFRSPFLTVGDGEFGVTAPAGLLSVSDRTPRGKVGCVFRPSNHAQFRAIYDALMSVVLEARRIGTDMVRYLGSSEPIKQTDPDVPGIQIFSELRIGEVTSHFDTDMAGRISGSLRHEFLGRAYSATR